MFPAFCAGFGKLVVEMLQLLAGGSLAIQSVVLAASLFQKIPEEQEAGPAPQPPRLTQPDRDSLARAARGQAVSPRGLLPSGTGRDESRSLANRQGKVQQFFIEEFPPLICQSC